jgi:hypothetical protein
MTIRMMSMGACLCLGLLPWLGCGSSSESNAGDAAAAAGGADATGGEGEEKVDQAGIRMHASRHAGVGHALSHAKTATEVLVQENPTIDPTKTVEQNADSIAAEIEAVKASTCPTLTLVHATGSATVSVTFPPSGCTANGVTISGKVDATVAKVGNIVSVTFAFVALKVSDHQLDGTVLESTSTGTSYTTKVTKLVADGTEYNFDGTHTMDSNFKGITTAGTGSSQAPGDKYPTTYTITGLHHLFAGCYADKGTLAGTIKTDVPGLKGKTTTVVTTTTVTFDENTPKDGTVDLSVKTGEKGTEMTTKDVKLPAYGSCPAA